MELKENKKGISNIINDIIFILIIGFIVLMVISGICFCKKWEWIVEQFGVAISTRDIDLLDELMDPLCEMYTTDNKHRVYSHNQRGVIENLWNEETYVATSCDPNLSGSGHLENIIFCWIKMEVLYITEMTVVDMDGKEYDLNFALWIRRKGLFDAKIVQTRAWIR